jgi:ATP-dependent DNA helicase DinG
MAIRGSCAYVKHEIGLHDAHECVVGSPFDFQRQGLLITSANAPDPQAKDFAERVSIIMHSIIDQAKGRTLGLFTSYRVLKAVAEHLRNQNCSYSILVQGEKPRMSLVKEFKEDTSSVLLGTESFWAGVDVPGEALSCLVIDKIPFPSPGDPVLEAMQEAAGGFQESFFKISIPRAVLQMRQGAGRLIRTERDRGVLVVLDRRLVTKGYGSIFVQSLPPMRRASSMRNGEIRDWLSL